MSPLTGSSVKPVWISVGLMFGGALSLMAQPTVSTGKGTLASGKPAQVFQKYCFECHGASKPEAGLSIQQLLTKPSVGAHSDAWEKVAGMLETGDMPPSDAEVFPSDDERKAA